MKNLVTHTHKLYGSYNWGLEYLLRARVLMIWSQLHAAWEMSGDASSLSTWLDL